MKVKYILNCTPTRSQDNEAGCPNFYEKEKSFVYKRIPIFDNKGEDILSHMTTAFNFIEEGKHYGNVLVHCHKGVSRSASFIIGYLMRKNEFTLEEALAHVQSCRPIVQPNSAFLEQLATYKPNEPSDNSGTSVQLEPTASIDVVDIGPCIGPFVSVSVGPSASGPISDESTNKSEQLDFVTTDAVMLKDFEKSTKETIGNSEKKDDEPSMKRRKMSKN